MISDSPRYHEIDVDPLHVQRDLCRFMRPGDRIVSVYPHAVQRPAPGVTGSPYLRAVLELRHPSWAEQKVGWVAGEDNSHVW